MGVSLSKFIFVLSALAVLSVVLLNYFLVGSLPADERGTFGDMFGASNALFSGLAFTGLIYTILLQMKELRAQRDELAATREELAGQKIALERQGELLEIQVFDSSFYELYKVFLSLIEQLSFRLNVGRIKDEYVYHTGRALFKYINNKALRIINRLEYEALPGKPVDDHKISEVHAVFDFIYDNDGDVFGTYVNSLRAIVGFVESSRLSDKKKYISIISSFMGEDELIFLLLYSEAHQDEVMIGILSKYDFLVKIPHTHPIALMYKDRYNFKS
jgi:hypothetical protein